MGLFLDKLCIFETHDQIELFLLHPLHFLLVQRLLLSLTRQFVLNLGSSAILFIHHFTLALSLCVLLLHADHLFDLVSAIRFIFAILLQHLTVVVLFSFGFDRLLLRLLVGHPLVRIHSMRILFFNVHMHLSSRSNLSHLVLLTFNLRSLHFHVAAALSNDVSCSFASFINFFDCLIFKSLNTILKHLPCLPQILTGLYDCRGALSPLQLAYVPS